MEETKVWTTSLRQWRSDNPLGLWCTLLKMPQTHKAAAGVSKKKEAREIAQDWRTFSRVHTVAEWRVNDASRSKACSAQFGSYKNRSSRRWFTIISFPVCPQSWKGEIQNVSHQSRMPSSHPSRTSPRLLPDSPCPGNPPCTAKFLHGGKTKQNHTTGQCPAWKWSMHLKSPKHCTNLYVDFKSSFK